jgi:hypothetical protein
MSDNAGGPDNAQTATIAPETVKEISAIVAAKCAQAHAAAADEGRQKAVRQADYQITVDIIKVFTDIRFRCLVFVTAVIAVANALILGSGDPGTRIALAAVGFVATLGIAIYELRNTQLYEAAISRAKAIELLLDMTIAERKSGGLFSERPLYMNESRWKDWSALGDEERKRRTEAGRVPLMRFLFVPVKHDHGLALIYGGALGGWVYLIASGVMSLPAPRGWWRPAPLGSIPFLASAISLAVFFVVVASFMYHDRHRCGPTVPK